MLDRLKAPEFKQVDTIDFIKAEKRFLKNNIPVFTINGGDQNLVRIEFIFDNVNWDAKKPLLTACTVTMLNEGTTNLTAAEIASNIDYYGSFFQTEYGLDRCNVVLYSLNKHLTHTLPIIKDVLTNSVFPEKELQTYINNQKQRLKVSLEKNDFLARRAFNKLLFDNTLYGYTVEESDFDDLKREDLLEYYSQSYHPQNCSIVLSGNINDDNFNTIDELFGTWQSEIAFKKNKFDFNEVKGEFKLIEKEQALQSAIRIGMPSINRTHPDFVGLQVLNTVLGGYFGSRLMANIREDKGYTYGIGSANVSLEQAGYFFITSEVGADVCTDTLKEIEKEINILKTELITDKELNLVKNYLMGSLLGSLENAFSHAEKFKNIYFYHLGYDYYDDYIKTVKSIKSQQLLELANKYWDYQQFLKIVVGKS